MKLKIAAVVLCTVIQSINGALAPQAAGPSFSVPPDLVTRSYGISTTTSCKFEQFKDALILDLQLPESYLNIMRNIDNLRTLIAADSAHRTQWNIWRPVILGMAKATYEINHKQLINLSTLERGQTCKRFTNAIVNQELVEAFDREMNKKDEDTPKYRSGGSGNPLLE